MPGWLEELDQRKTQYGAGASRRKKKLLAVARRGRIRTAEELQTYHEALCFLRAFPDDPSIMRLAEAELRGFARRVPPFRDELAGTGVCGTAYAYPFGLPMATWLVDRFGDAVEIDWDAYEERENDNLAGILSPVAGWVETAALDDELLTAREWFERTRGGRRGGGPSRRKSSPRGEGEDGGRDGALRRLIDRLRKSGLPPETLEALYNALDVPLTWELGNEFRFADPREDA